MWGCGRESPSRRRGEPSDEGIESIHQAPCSGSAFWYISWPSCGALEDSMLPGSWIKGLSLVEHSPSFTFYVTKLSSIALKQFRTFL